MHKKLTNLFHAFMALCFPSSCLLCDKALPTSDILICRSCLPEVSFTQRPLCTCCGVEFPCSAKGDHYCAKCLVNRPAFSMARAILRYNDDVSKLVHSFKYAGKTYCHSTFAGLKNKSLPVGDLRTPDIIIPVPLHLKRLRERGFNQSVILANLFFPDDRQRINVNLLTRTRVTTPQTGLSGSRRRKNIKNAFDIHHPNQLKGQSVLLVDDVFTTGTTLNECAKTLKKYGASDVQALTLARVVG